MSPALKSNIKYILLGFIAYFVFLLANMPAGFAYGQWKKSAGQSIPINLNDVDGTIWQGKAGPSMINGQQIVGFSWDISIFTMLLGILEMDFEMKVKDGYTKGTMGRSLFGGTYFNNLEGWMPLSEIKNLINLAALDPGGDLDIKVSNVKLEDNTIVSAQGDITWHNAELTMLKKIVLGGVNIMLAPDGDTVKATLADQGGPLKAEGTLILKPDRTYELEMSLGVNGSQPDLSNALATLGPAKNGRIKVSQKGDLSSLGF